MSVLTTLAHALLGRPATTTPRSPGILAAPYDRLILEDVVATLDLAEGPAATLDHALRADAVAGARSMALRHPERLAKTLTAAQQSDRHFALAARVFAEYIRHARTRTHH